MHVPQTISSNFCHPASGGMPCLLKPPDPSQTVVLADLGGMFTNFTY